MSKTTKSYEKSQKRDIRVEKTASAQVAIGEIKKNHDVFILTFGQFSLIDALIAILRQTGPADVNISTWTAAHAHLDKTASLMEGIVLITARKIKTCNEMRKRIDEEGHVVRDLSGKIVSHPAIKILEDTEKQLIDILSQYGEKSRN